MGVCSVIRGAAAKLLRENNRLESQLNEERQNRADLEDAVLELSELFAEQDDALVELAEMIVEG